MVTKYRNALILSICMLLLLFAFFIYAYSSDSHENADNKDFSSDRQNENTITDEIFIKGSDTILPISLAETEAYMKLHPDKKIIVIGGGSSLGLASFTDGEVEIAMASRKIQSSEIANAANNSVNPVETVIAWDGISVIVSKDNPVENLSVEQLKSIYDGTLTNWKQVGGKDEKIKALVRDTSSGTYGFFKEHVLLDSEYSQDAITEPNTEAVVEAVSADTAAIGYIGLAYADASVKTIGLETSGGIFYPETESIINGDYPLSRPLQYYTDGQAEGTAKEYIDFVLSDQGQEIISDVGYLPVN